MKATPSPTSLPVNPHKIQWLSESDKAFSALRLALCECHIYRIEDGWEALGMLGGIDEGLTRETLKLNPNVLDPEDAVLVARVLGAVLVQGGITAQWVDGEGLVAYCAAPTATWLETGLIGWRIKSIPSLNLHRR